MVYLKKKKKQFKEGHLGFICFLFDYLLNANKIPNILQFPTICGSKSLEFILKWVLDSCIWKKAQYLSKNLFLSQALNSCDNFRLRLIFQASLLTVMQRWFYSVQIICADYFKMCKIISTCQWVTKFEK